MLQCPGLLGHQLFEAWAWPGLLIGIHEDSGSHKNLRVMSLCAQLQLLRGMAPLPSLMF